MSRLKTDRLWPTVLLSAAVAWSQAAFPEGDEGPAAEAPPAPASDTLPEPDLSLLEPQVTAQLEEARGTLRALQSNSAPNAERANGWGDLGKLYQVYELTDAAEHCYRRALELAPKVFQWHYYLARLYQESGRPREALDRYRSALLLEPDSTLVLARLGEVQLELDDIEGARRDLLQALYLRPGATAVLARLGEVALAEERYQLATLYLAAAIERNPGANRLNYLLGMAHRGLGREDQAREYLARQGAVGIQPPDPWLEQLQQLVRGERLHLLRGKMAFRAGQYEAAAAAFREAVSANKDSARAHINLGSTLAHLGQVAQAIKQYRVALGLEPESFTARFNLGQLLLLGGSTAEAAAQLARAIEQDPNDAEAHLLLARALQALGRTDEALKLYSTSVHLDPTLEDAWARGPQLLVDLGRFSEAVGVLERAHGRLPHSPRITHALARALAGIPERDLRDGARAQELALKAYETKPSATYAATVAMAYAESAECEQAVAWQQRALDEMPQEAAGTEGRRKAMSGLLEHYQTTRPCRYP